MDEQSIPIDINTTKLLDWLISRRHVDKDFQDNVMAIREKINSAIQDMPAHEGIIKLLSGQHINYFHCLKIIDILKETEADTKNLFGRYGSQRMKDWQDIVQCYQRGNLYLAEAAQMLMRNVSYEVPSLKKQVAKLDQTQLECEKKLKDFTRTETIALNEFNSSCKQLGITGNHIKKELIELLNELPKIYETACKTIATVDPALNLYSAFVKFHMRNEVDIDVLPLLKYLIKHGNTTTYEYIYGEKPIGIETLQLNIVDEKTDNIQSDTINFGEEINFDEENFGDIDANTNLEFISASLNEGEIDWGNSNEDDFEIVEHVDLDVNLEESGIVVENSGLDGGIAKGNDAYTILDNPKTQNLILNDLMELEAFLKMRLYEMASESGMLSVAQIDAPTILQMQTMESITAMNDCVRISLTEVTNKKTQHLHNIKHSPRYVDLLTASLKQKLNVVDRMRANKKVFENKILEARKEVTYVKPVITNIIEKTKLLQKQIEDDISRKYKGRRVNIVGGVNMM